MRGMRGMSGRKADEMRARGPDVENAYAAGGRPAGETTIRGHIVARGRVGDQGRDVGALEEDAGAVSDAGVRAHGLNWPSPLPRAALAPGPFAPARALPVMIQRNYSITSR